MFSTLTFFIICSLVLEKPSGLWEVEAAFVSSDSAISFSHGRLLMLSFYVSLVKVFKLGTRQTSSDPGTVDE